VTVGQALKQVGEVLSLVGQWPEEGAVHILRGGVGGVCECCVDRQANAALWRIALVRLNCDQRSKDYLAKRISDGKSKTEALR